MKKAILITGGAGFIGSHVAEDLLQHGYRVRVLDNLSVSVHGRGFQRPSYLPKEIELIIDDIQDPEAVRRAVKGMDAVCHLASAVGATPSMYDVRTFTSVNMLGTAVLLDALMENPVARLVMASSVNVYGEGLYRNRAGVEVHAAERKPAQLRVGDWNLRDDAGEMLEPLATPESKPAVPGSIYALSKLDQERMCLLMSRAYGIPTVVLRVANVYGARQLLVNPYAGVVSVFASRLMHNSPPVVFEDGEQLRDLVSVRDVAHAFRLALETPHAAGEVINIGSGAAVAVGRMAMRLAVMMAKRNIAPKVTGSHRVFDARHCFADIRAARQVLGYEPRVSLDQGLAEIVLWLDEQVPYDKVSA